MKSIRAWFLALVLVLSMALVAQPNEAMAVPVQKQQVQQPSKQDVRAILTQPSKDQVLATVRAGSTAKDTTADVITSCSLCYTCGGSWSSYGGYIPLPEGSQPGERAGGCSGDLTSRSDTSPYLCCHTSP